MVLSITHSTVATFPDQPGVEINKAEWNADHQFTGTMDPSQGGTGTATAFTSGSIVFAGASGVYSQDNANLFWDNTNDRLGVGTASPSSKLHVKGTFNTLQCCHGRPGGGGSGATVGMT